MVRNIFSSLLLLSLPIAAQPFNWQQWRGPTRDGMVAEGSPNWPTRLNADNLKRLWSVDLAEGYSSPVIAGPRVFTVETRDRKNEIVRAFDRHTGEQLWETTWPGSMKVPFFASKNGSWVRCTPATDGSSLFVGGMLDVLVALDVETGESRWRADFPAQEDTPRPQFGFVSSPMLDEDSIYVQVGTGLRRIRKSDGKTLWMALEDERAMFGSAFSSPTRAKIGGIDQILVQTRMMLAGVRPDSGAILWSTPVMAFRGMNILTPTPIGDHVFTATYGGGTRYFDIATEDDGQSVTQVWNDELEGYMTSPVVIDGKVYLLGRNKRFHCIDPAARKVLWSTDKTYGDYWSLVSDGKRILALDNRGVLLLIEADPSGFKLIDKLEVSDRPTWAHLAVCGNELYIRDLKGLTAYRWE